MQEVKRVPVLDLLLQLEVEETTNLIPTTDGFLELVQAFQAVLRAKGTDTHQLDIASTKFKAAHLKRKQLLENI